MGAMECSGQFSEGGLVYRSIIVREAPDHTRDMYIFPDGGVDAGEVLSLDKVLYCKTISELSGGNLIDASSLSAWTSVGGLPARLTWTHKSTLDHCESDTHKTTLVILSSTATYLLTWVY